MEGEVSTNTQMGFSAGGAGENGAPSSPADSSPSTVSQSTETSTTDSSATGNDSGLPPAASQPVAEKAIAQSEKGSFVLRFNERTGRNEVVSTMPEETEPQEEEQEEVPDDQRASQSQQPQQQLQQQPQQAPQQNYAGNELLNALNNPQPIQPQAPQPNAEYTLQELQTAIQTGRIDEARIPLALRPGYYAAVEQARQQMMQAQQEAAKPVDETAQAKEFYSRVNAMAQERAMKEIGVTQDELDVAEYTDDQALIDKVNAYKVSVENNRARILQDVNNIQQNQVARQQDTQRAYDAIGVFVQEMKQKEPNFDAIDKLMITRVAKMPYEQAIKVAPLVQKVQNGTLTTADLPALQEMYNQTRLEYYSSKTGVGVAPKVVNKPAFVENPGTGKEAPRKTTPLSALGTMSKRDREAAIGQMFGNFFDDDE